MQQEVTPAETQATCTGTGTQTGSAAGYCLPVLSQCVLSLCTHGMETPRVNLHANVIVWPLEQFTTTAAVPQWECWPLVLLCGQLLVLYDFGAAATAHAWAQADSQLLLLTSAVIPGLVRLSSN